MIHWFELLVNSQAVKSIYKDEVPSLRDVDVHSLLLHRDGPKLSIRLNLKDYPSNPPEKWSAQGFNTVQIVFSFLDLKSISMSGWIGAVYLADINIDFKNGLVALNIDSDKFKLTAEASFLDLESIVAYTKG
ncbi:immunity 50 family protein [Pseudomonas asiatica]|uniref:Imm50 family immunity protein n=1 Tax=Pseudomonas asiatica TaxID=2219225 RepID=UPI002DB86A57|nr:Imm50 family immunity protein [Pseudomonas asiatica]MEB6587835.1 immunity 50 family protein [Pseudomonas asiatica]